MLQHESAEYVSPIRAVRRARVRSVRRSRSRPDLIVLYAAAAVAGMVSGLFLSLLA